MSHRLSGSSSSWRKGEKQRASSPKTSHTSSNSEGSYHFTKPELPKTRSVATLVSMKKDSEVGSMTIPDRLGNSSVPNTNGMLRRDCSRDNIPPVNLITRRIEPPPASPPIEINGHIVNNNNSNNMLSSSPSNPAALNRNCSFVSKSPTLAARDRNITALSPNGTSQTSQASSTFTPIAPPEYPVSPARTPSSVDVDGLMSRTWGECYNEGELTVQVVESNISSMRSLQDIEVTLIVNSHKPLFRRWGQDFLLETEHRSFGEIALELATVSRIHTRKRIGTCKVALQRLEEGKPQEGWHNISKRSSKGEIRSKGHLKVRVCYTSSLYKNQDYCMTKERFDEIMQILFDKETLIVCALCKLHKEEDLSKALIRLFNSQKQAAVLLQNLLSREIYSSEDTATLFRRDSMATKTVRNFFSLVAKSYLKKHIMPFVAYVISVVKNGGSFEVDPAKLASTAEITTNSAKLLAGVKKFLSSILDSCDDLPISVRLCFCKLNIIIRKRIKSSSPVGALFFLRFVCPAVLFPSQYGLMDKPLPENIFRSLVLVTKILTNLVNGCLFHEEYMAIFNSFITDNVAPMNGFLEQLCTEPKTHLIVQDDQMPPYSAEDLIQLLSIVVHKIHANLDKMQTELEQDPVFQYPTEEEHQKVLFAKLRTLFLERILKSPDDEREFCKAIN